MSVQPFQRLATRPLIYVVAANFVMYGAGLLVGLRLPPQQSHNNVPAMSDLVAHNLIVGMLILVSGLATFSIMSLLLIGGSAIYNGIVIGASVNTRGAGWTILHLSHAPLEIVAFSAFFLAGTLTLRVLLEKNFSWREQAIVAAQLVVFGGGLMVFAGLLETMWKL